MSDPFSTSEQRSLPYFCRIDFDVFAVRADRLALLVSTQGFPHVESICAVGVIVYYSPIDRVAFEVSRVITKYMVSDAHPIFW